MQGGKQGALSLCVEMGGGVLSLELRGVFILNVSHPGDVL